MKQMQVEFTEWLKVNEVNPDPEHSDKIDDYRKQYLLINKIIGIYESSDYTNEKYHSEIADLLDELEQLGDSPVAKGFNNSEAGNDMSELAKLLEIQGDDNIGEIDKDLEDTCKQQWNNLCDYLAPTRHVPFHIYVTANLFLVIKLQYQTRFFV